MVNAGLGFWSIYSGIYRTRSERLELVGLGSEAHRLGAGGVAMGLPLLGPSDRLIKRAGGNSGEQRHDQRAD
jgi:hypothetical protein